jgi:hypothetical protein
VNLSSLGRTKSAWTPRRHSPTQKDAAMAILDQREGNAQMTKFANFKRA